MRILALVGVSGELLGTLRASHKVEIAESQGQFADMVAVDLREGQRHFDALLASLPREGNYLGAYVRALGWKKPVVLVCKDILRLSQDFVELAQWVGKDVAVCLASDELSADKVESVIASSKLAEIEPKPQERVAAPAAPTQTKAASVNGASVPIKFEIGIHSISNGSTRINCLEKEIALARYLMEHPNQVKGKKEVAEHLKISEVTARQYLSNLCGIFKRLSLRGKGPMVNVRGEGYKYIPTSQPQIQN